MPNTILLEEMLVSEDEGLFARDVNGRLARMDKATAGDYDKRIPVKIDGQEVTVAKAVPTTDSQGNLIRDADGKTVPRATTIYDAAVQLFVQKPGDRNPIPVLCHQEHLRPVGVCRMCVVEISKMKRGQVQRERKLLPACQHRVEPTMEVHTVESPDLPARERVRSSVRVLAELLAADHLRDGNASDHAPYNELFQLCERLGVQQPRFAKRSHDRGRDDSSTVIAVDHNACILCDRCVRACDEVKKNVVIGRTGKGYTARVGFDLDLPMGKSSCVSCGECMITCPTGALTFRSVVNPAAAVAGPEADVVPAEELKNNPEGKRNYGLFAGVPYKFLQWNTGAVVRRRLKPGQILCREGEFGSTAYILVKGRFQIAIRSALKQVRTERAGGVAGLFGRLKTSLAGGADADPTRTVIRNDGALALTVGNPVAIRTPEDIILGEMTCMSHYPRSATVVAIDEAEVLEISRNVLYALQRTKAARDTLDRVYRERALTGQLQNVPILAALPEKDRRGCLDFLRERVELVRVDPGQVIFRQGERADHFYLVRLGFVKVTQELQGAQRVLDYLGPGRYFGEIGLLSGLTDLLTGKVPEGREGTRTATCTALDDVELVRVRGDHFRQLVDRYAPLRDKLVRDAVTLLNRNEEQSRKLNRPLGDFLKQGLFNAQKLLVLDLERCTRCDECTKACADSHDGVTRLIREGLRYDRFLVASSCRSCLDPYCLVGCPVDSIHRHGSLEIVIEDWCIGCGQCAKNCPYGNINMHPFPEMVDDPLRPGRRKAVKQMKATTCDLCRNVVGAGEDPSCVYACPHDAAFRMSGEQLLKAVEGRSTRAP